MDPTDEDLNGWMVENRKKLLSKTQRGFNDNVGWYHCDWKIRFGFH